MCNLQVYLLFSDSKTMAKIVNYTCKSYIKLTPDLDFLKLAKKRKSVCSALFRGNVCIWSDKISNVSAILGRK